ncbi:MULTISPECIES: terminus macrodomain insulation protein YfbV [Corallincola]|uniref:terminus macrodomain insulation protein YfbV n=1 Tax=Corallincola TaxID=1775176 RepID=UPI0013146B29|nr:MULTISPECIES: terminus macrodomain insulation protein YfbV [Corallincola]
MSQLTELLQQGQRYMNIWPIRPELYRHFPEIRVIQFTRWATRWLPGFAVMLPALQYLLVDGLFFAQMIAVSLLLMSIPFQGLLWLGHRATQPLPPSLSGWYRDIHARMNAEGCQISPVKSQPQFLDMGALLNQAFKQLESSRLQRIF